MAIQIFKEAFTGKLDMVSPAVLLPVGGIVDGKNVRKVGKEGGWKPRKGCTLHDTDTVDSTNAVDSLHDYKNPRSLDQHFIAQCHSKLYRESAANRLPPFLDPGFGADMGVTVGTTPGFSTVVGETLLYADGSGAPIVWGGDTPYPFAVFTYDSTQTEYVDITRKVTDGRSDTDGFFNGSDADTDSFIIITTEIASAIAWTLGTNKNTTANRTATVEAWRSGAWADVSLTSDGTELAADKTMSKSGSMVWTAGSDEMKMVNNVLGYAYKVSFSGTFSNDIDVTAITVVMAAANMTNKWDGNFEWVSGCRFFDQSVGEYVEALGKITNESTSQYLNISAATTSDFIYIKTPEPATAFGLGIPADYSNTADAQVVTTGSSEDIEFWDGDSYTKVSNLVDKTLNVAGNASFAHTGVFYFDGSAITPVMTTLKGDPIPGYWYRISWDASLAADTRIFMIVYAPFPDSLPAYDGVVEFKGRAAVWGDPEFPNRLRISAKDRYDCFSGTDSTYTDAFGDMSKITCAINFYNELIVFKENSVWLLEGFNPATFGTLKIADTVGLASPKTAYVVEIGYPGMHQDEPLSIAIWEDTDGIYVLDGRKPRKVSPPIDNYFNPEHSDAIPAANIKTLQAFTDQINNEYHLLLPTEELVYNYADDEWYPPWTRAISLNTGINLKGRDNRYHTYGGSSAGWLMRLENDTTDKNTSNQDVAIDHSVKTRAISAIQETSTSAEFLLRFVWAEMKARGVGSIVTTVFKDMISSGAVQATPSALSMVSTASAGMVAPKLEMSIEGTLNFQAQFALNIVDQELEIYSMLYAIEVRGVPKR